MTHEEKMAALEAGRVLNSAAFNAVWDELDAKAVEAWRHAKTVEQREECWMTVKALALVKDSFFSKLQSAALAENGRDETLNGALKTAKARRNRKSEGDRR